MPGVWCDMDSMHSSSSSGAGWEDPWVRNRSIAVKSDIAAWSAAIRGTTNQISKLWHLLFGMALKTQLTMIRALACALTPTLPRLWRGLWPAVLMLSVAEVQHAHVHYVLDSRVRPCSSRRGSGVHTAVCLSLATAACRRCTRSPQLSTPYSSAVEPLRTNLLSSYLFIVFIG